MASPGLLTLLTAREREQVRSEAKKDAMHSRVCLITLILPLITCNLTILSLYPFFLCYQA